MNKKLRKLAASAIIAATMLTGCGVAGEVPADTTAPIETTVPATEPAAPYAQGQAVFVVYDAGDGIVGMRRLFVVAVVEDLVIVTTAVPDSGEEGEVLTFPIGNCYADEDEAWKVSGMEPME